MRLKVARCRGVTAAAVAAVLITMELILYVAAASMAEIDDSGEATNIDESTTAQNIVKILYCTS
jgi:hypothetical protein